MKSGSTVILVVLLEIVHHSLKFSGVAWGVSVYVLLDSLG